MDIDQFVERVEFDVRTGNTARAINKLKVIKPHEIPADGRLKVAILCRRSLLLEKAIAILEPSVKYRQFGTLKPEALPAELAEYALLLFRIGVRYEAKRILSKIDAKAEPIVDFYRAFISLGEWDMNDARVCLRTFLATDPPEYLALTARVNLCATAVEESKETSEFNFSVDELIRELEAKDYRHLLGNCLEMKAQNQINSGDLKEAAILLQRARSLLSKDKSKSLFFVELMETVLASINSANLTALLHFRKRAQRLEEWECIRECDRYCSHIVFDERRYNHLYFGSPLEGFRKILVNRLGVVPETQEYRYGARDSKVLDLATGKTDRGLGLRLGGNSLKLLNVLLKDFYRPQRLGEIFSDLFPNDSFDLESSNARVNKLVQRTRADLKAAKIPVDILIRNGNYSLKIREPFAFLVRFEKAVSSPEDLFLDLLKQKFPAPTFFSNSDLVALLRLSKSTVNGLLRDWIAAGIIRRQGEGPATKYQMAPQ